MKPYDIITRDVNILKAARIIVPLSPRMGDNYFFREFVKDEKDAPAFKPVSVVWYEQPDINNWLEKPEEKLLEMKKKVNK